MDTWIDGWMDRYIEGWADGSIHHQIETLSIVHGPFQESTDL